MKTIRILSAVILIGIALLRIASCNNYGKKLTFNGGEVYYTDQVTEADAKKLGEYLVKEKFFDGTRKTIQLNKAGSTFEVRMVVKKDTEKAPTTVTTFTAVAQELSREVFSGAKVVIHLCDDHLKTLKVVP
jgi:hypothetical protein